MLIYIEFGSADETLVLFFGKFSSKFVMLKIRVYSFSLEFGSFGMN